jgi:hypothetical protein
MCADRFERKVGRRDSISLSAGLAFPKKAAFATPNYIYCTAPMQLVLPDAAAGAVQLTRRPSGRNVTICPSFCRRKTCPQMNMYISGLLFLLLK